MENQKITFEMREVEQWFNEEDGWFDNTSYVIGTFSSNAENLGKAFRNALAKHGITFKKYKTVAIDYCDYIEIVARSTGEVLFRAMPINLF